MERDEMITTLLLRGWDTGQSVVMSLALAGEMVAKYGITRRLPNDRWEFVFAVQNGTQTAVSAGRLPGSDMWDMIPDDELKGLVQYGTL
jgi:hypothetical protein